MEGSGEKGCSGENTYCGDTEAEEEETSSSSAAATGTGRRRRWRGSCAGRRRGRDTGRHKLNLCLEEVIGWTGIETIIEMGCRELNCRVMKIGGLVGSGEKVCVRGGWNVGDFE